MAILAIGRYVLTYLADLQWCHVAPLRESGIFGPKPSQAAQLNPALTLTLPLTLPLSLPLTPTLAGGS